MPCGFGVFLVRVRLPHGFPPSLYTSNCGAKKDNAPDRQRALELGRLEISAASGRHASVVYGRFLVVVCIYPGGSVSPDRSIYCISQENLPWPMAETGDVLSRNIACARTPRTVRLRVFPDPCNHFPRRFCFACYIELYGRPCEPGRDGHSGREIGRLEISIISGRPCAITFRAYLLFVGFYGGVSLTPGKSDYRTTKAKRHRSTADAGRRPSGNISCEWAPHAVRSRGFPRPCRHLSGWFCFASYIEL